jgi:hypothetical protein
MGTIKRKIDFFPHDCKPGRTLKILKSIHGNDGFAFWFQLLQILGDTEGHFYDASTKINWLHLVSECGVDEPTARKIMKTIVDIEAIDVDIWRSNAYIWCQHFVDRLEEVYKRRQTAVPIKPVLKPLNVNIDWVDVDIEAVDVCSGRQSRVEKNKAFKAKALKGEQPATEETDPSDILDEGYNPPPDETNDPKDDTKPKKVRQPRSMPVIRFQEITKAWPNSEQIKLIDETVITNVDLDRFESVVKTWMLRGFKPTNVEGMIEWYRSGIPSRTNGGNKPTGKPATVASTEEDLDDWKKLQAEQKERQEARAAKEKQGGS